MTETGREQAIRYMEQLEQLTAERDRLRHQNAELLGQLDAIEFAYNVILAERDRLREALIEQAKLTAYEALVDTGVTAEFARSEWEDWLCPEARAAITKARGEE